MEELNHAEAQEIFKAEQVRCGQADLTHLASIEEDESHLEGEPLNLKECRKLCPNYFVRHQLFRISGNAKETAPLKLSDLQHKGLARVLLQRFIRQERAMPNNNQVAIYFIQQCYVRYILGKKVDWSDRPGTAGVGRGRIAEKVAARNANIPTPPRKRPVVMLPEESEIMEAFASQGQDLASQGETPDILRGRILELEIELAERDSRLARYEALYGPLPVDAGSTSQDAGSTPTFDLDDFIQTLNSQP